MTKFIILVSASTILFIIFVVLSILAFIKRTKRLFILSVLSLLIFFSTGVYTLYFGVKKGKEKTITVTKTVMDNAFPKFDSETPDTKSNKKHFREFLKINITPDIKNIYCFDDAIGQDADYMFSFNCDSLTTKKIIELHELKKDSTTGNNPESLQHDFFWWDKKKIQNLESYSWSSNNEGKNVHKLFWYDKPNQQAYYFEYDL